MKKYIKPTSMTWLAGMVPLSSGLFIAFEPVHHLTEYAQSVSAMYGDTSPAFLINSGLIAIGLRGAVK